MTDLLLIGARALHFGSGLVLAGVVAFRWLVLRPGLKARGDGAWIEYAGLLRQLRFIMCCAFAVLVASGAAMFWAVAAGMSGNSLGDSLGADTLGPVFFETQFGEVTQWRIGLAIGWLAAFLWLGRAGWLQPPRLSLPEAILGLAGFSLMMSMAWAGHAAASGPGWRVWADAVHLLAASVWPAGLLPFALFLVAARGSSGGALVTTANVFSRVSFITVGFLVASGVINSCFMLGGVAALVATTYGQILLVKLGFFAIILGFASVNRYRFVPRLTGIEDASLTGTALAGLRKFVAAEICVAVAIIAVVAVLGVTSPR